ncbi:MAG: Flp pilus assembly complex ATPase component TadA [Desulfobacterales bacterium]|nr:Flp pilus assembly complex ATPase component TadA [Desulfobacterales bacterium]
MSAPQTSGAVAQPKKRIGDILIDLGFIDQDQLRMALAESKKTGIMLGDVLLRLDWVNEEKLNMAIAVQSGAQILNISKVHVDPTILAKVPQDFAKTHDLFPYSVEKNTLKVATSNPFDVLARDKLSRLTGYRVETYIAPKEWIAKAIEVHYNTALTIDEDIEKISKSGITVDDDQIIKLSNLLIDKGYVSGASDIHVVPDVNLTRTFYRIDGVLNQNYLFPKTFHAGIVTRFKVMADMDISNPNIPHDGRIKYSGKVGDLSLRVSSFPTHLGEIMVMRLLVYGGIVGDLAKLGFEKDDYEKFIKNINRPYGLILTTGPTGSGKTTTLYTALMTVNNPHINVMTIEDPIEYVIPTIRQTAVNPKAGFTFHTALRAALRQDPDVILVGEIRDKETAELAISASNTGHLVFSTLHTNEAAAAINRLIDLGVNTSMLASALSLVAAQRLVRRACPNCVTKEAPTDKEKEIFTKNGLKTPAMMPKAVGCPSCSHSGYRGRAGVYEVIQINREIQELIFKAALQSTIEDAAMRDGTALLIKQGLKKIHYQITTLEEIFRVIAYA